MESTLFFAHTNMYVVLVGPPGSKKSTAIRQGRKLLKQIPGINMTSDAPSVVGVMQDFKDIPQKDHQSLNAFILELSSLFENATETMTGFLTAIYDGDLDYIKRTRIGGKEHIPYPWFNLLGATTPTWLGDNLTKNAVEGGLVARTLYVYSEEVILKSSWPEYDPELRELEKSLIHDLAHISALNGEFTFEGGRDGDAFKWYDSWYLDRARFPRIMDNRMAGYYARKHIHMLKVAMSVALSQSDNRVLTIEHLHTALALLNDIEPGMTRAFSAVGSNVYATEIERVEMLVRGDPEGILYSDIVAATYHNMEQRYLDSVLQTLEAMGRIIRGSTSDGKRAYTGARR